MHAAPIKGKKEEVKQKIANTMSSNSSKLLPLQEKIIHHHPLERVCHLLILFLLFTLLLYRVDLILNGGSSFMLIIAFLCELWFAFYWYLILNCRWNLVSYQTYPERLIKRYEDLPAVDIFITTADPELEPPIITANTMLSLLSLEYPTNRLACYVSDDGISPVTYYAIKEASEFGKLWVPFCRKYSVQVRAPFLYFSVELNPAELLLEFVEEWKQMKIEYEELCRKVEGAAKNYGPYQDQMKEELVEFSASEQGNHPSIIKVISENKGEDDIPHVVYVAREKRPNHPHHFKAGAMNVLTRVSGVMTNAPFILNVDCDMFANNPKLIPHSMCLLLGFDNEISSGFVQAPQQFYNALKDDPFGNHMEVLLKKVGRGFDGTQGPYYSGTGCFHRRKIIYGTSPNDHTSQLALSDTQLQRIYGHSKELIESIKESTSDKTLAFQIKSRLSSILPAAKEVAACSYERKTSWGKKKIGWMYGSVTEDILTGLWIHARGWRSVYLWINPPAFLGDTPTSATVSLTQFKRWGTGLLEILCGRNSPIFALLYENLSFRQCLNYLWITMWSLCAPVEFLYALLPAYCVITNSFFLPKASSKEFIIPAALFIIYNVSTLVDFIECQLTIRAWWNNQRMNRIVSASSFLFSFLPVISKLFGLSSTIFEVTKKDEKDPTENVDVGRFTFNSSSIFVPVTMLLFVHVASLVVAMKDLVMGNDHSWGVGEVVCSLWMILSFWPFVRGLFGRGIYGIPWSVICKAACLSCFFLQLCWMIKVK